MTDLTNRANNLEQGVVTALVEKYKELIPHLEINDQGKLLNLLYIINLSLNFISANHNEETPDWKTWAMILIIRLFRQEKLETREDIYNNINKFFNYIKAEYEKYVSNIALYSDEYYRDSPFIDNYIKQL